MKEQERKKFETIIGECWEKINKELPNGVNPHAYRLGFLDAIDFTANNPNNKVEGWVDEKPDFKEDCILLTASVFRGQWEYNSWEVKWLNFPEGGYMALCCLDGEEYGALDELKADKYKIISPLPEPPIKAQ